MNSRPRQASRSGPRHLRRYTVLLCLLASGMFGFAFALVPMYEVFCEWTGVNGKTANRAATVEQQLSLTAPSGDPTDRTVTIQFFAQSGKGMPWEFRPLERQLRVRPGQSYSTYYYARNRARRAVTGQAVPSVSPGGAAAYLHKTECFCFSQQRLEAGESVEMPVTFIVDRELPADVKTLSLSYTLFPIVEHSATDMSAVAGPDDPGAGG